MGICFLGEGGLDGFPGRMRPSARHFPHAVSLVREGYREEAGVIVTGL